MSSLFRSFPYFSPSRALLLLSVAVAVVIFFMAHAVVRVANGSIPGFAEFLAVRGWLLALVLVWSVSIVEIISGLLLVAGRCMHWAASALMFIAFMSIVIVHAKLGWFVGEHRTSGMEYSLVLIVSLITIAAVDRDANSVLGGRSPRSEPCQAQ